MIKYSWEDLCKFAVDISFTQSSRNLDKLTDFDPEFLVFTKSSLNISKEAAREISETDPGDRQPFRILNLGWQSISEYMDAWVVVPSHIFDIPSAPVFTEPTKSTANQFTSTTGEQIMPTNTTTSRRTVRIELIDNDHGLDVQHSLVAAYDNVVTEDDDNTTIQEVIMNRDIARKLREHNQVRESQVDLDVQKRTGNTVNLQPVKLKDLTWIVK